MNEPSVVGMAPLFFGCVAMTIPFARPNGQLGHYRSNCLDLLDQKGFKAQPHRQLTSAFHTAPQLAIPCDELFEVFSRCDDVVPQLIATDSRIPRATRIEELAVCVAN